MKPFFLSEIVTKDKLVHQGLYAEPTNKGNKAILWVHGLTSTFYNNVKTINILADWCEQFGMGLATFNNRGHDLIAGIRKVDKRLAQGYTHVDGGAGYEVFDESVWDIDAGISFLFQKGYKQIILVGHSTGANKVCFYAGAKKDSRVAGVVLASPVADRLDASREKKQLEKDLVQMKKLIASGKGDTLLFGYHFFPLTPKRFVSLFDAHTHEDTFDYGEQKPLLKQFRKIRKPFLVILGSADENLDRPAKDVLYTYDSAARSEKYESILFENTLHSYNGKEKEVVKTIVEWAQSI